MTVLGNKRVDLTRANAIWKITFGLIGTVVKSLEKDDFSNVREIEMDLNVAILAIWITYDIRELEFYDGEWLTGKTLKLIKKKITAKDDESEMTRIILHCINVSILLYLTYLRKESLRT